jgi:hypothetical protein
MCDLFAPDMVTVNYTRQYARGKYFIESSWLPLPVVYGNGSIVVAGVCKCTPNAMYASVLGAEQVGVWRSVLFMLLVTTVVPKVFRKAFELEHNGEKRWSCAECTADLMMLLLLVIVGFELSVCTIVGDTMTWRNGLLRALTNALLFQPVVSIVLPSLWQRCCCFCSSMNPSCCMHPEFMHPPWVNPSYTGNFYDYHGWEVVEVDHELEEHEADSDEGYREAYSDVG